MSFPRQQLNLAIEEITRKTDHTDSDAAERVRSLLASLCQHSHADDPALARFAVELYENVFLCDKRYGLHIREGAALVVIVAALEHGVHSIDFSKATQKLIEGSVNMSDEARIGIWAYFGAFLDKDFVPNEWQSDVLLARAIISGSVFMSSCRSATTRISEESDELGSHACSEVDSIASWRRTEARILGGSGGLDNVYREWQQVLRTSST